MSVFKRINKSDVVTVPYIANKQWNFSNLSINSSSIYIYTGKKVTGSFDSANDLLTTNSQYQRLIFDSINHQFYQAYSGSLVDNTNLLQSYNYESASIYRASSSYVNGVNISYGTGSFPEAVGSTIIVITIPSSIYGDSLNPNTFILSSSAYYIQDDGNGNLKNGNELVGNIFYPQGLAVITNQNYQTYFNDTSTVVVSWSNFENPSGYYIDSNLLIKVNGVDKIQANINETGRFTANVGDTLSVAAWSNGTWPSTGTSSLHLTTTGQTHLSSSLSGGYITESFTLTNSASVSINSYTNYTPDIAPANIVWNFAEYYEPGVSFLDGSFKIQSAGGSTVYLNRAVSGSGTLTIPAGITIETKAYAYTTQGTSSWGPYVSASMSASVIHSGITVGSNNINLYKNGGDITTTTTPSVTLEASETYYVNVGIGSPVPAPAPATINWTLAEYFEPNVAFLDGNFMIESADGLTTYLTQFYGGSGSVSVPSNQSLHVKMSSFTNEAGGVSVWGPYVSGSLSGSLSSASVSSSAQTSIYKNGGLITVTTTPNLSLAPGSTYTLVTNTTLIS